MKVVEEGVQHLVDYRKFLSQLEGGSSSCSGLQGQAGDRAFDAESTFRVMLAETVQSLNDLRDSGMFHAQLESFAATLGTEEKSVSGMFQGMKEELSKAPIHLPDEFFQELHAMLERQDVQMRHDAKSGVIVMRGRRATGDTPVTIRVRLSPQVGDLGRVGVEQFFGADGGAGLLASRPVPAPPDCHHQSNRTEAEHSRTVDAYSTLLGGLATARESMYRHARKVSEYGHGETMVRAHDPVVVFLALAAVYAIVGVVFGFLYAFGASILNPIGSAILSFLAFGLAVACVLIVFIFWL
jgi:hypothetical protein